jgi:PhnB protein
VHKPPGWPDVVPRIFTSDVAGLVRLMRQALGAQGEAHAERPAEMRLGQSIVMVSDGAGVRNATPAFLYVYVPDADVAYARAVALGARSIEPPSDLPYGDRRATVEDAWGNTWQIATRRAVE